MFVLKVKAHIVLRWEGSWCSNDRRKEWQMYGHGWKMDGWVGDGWMHRGCAQDRRLVDCRERRVD